MTAKRPFRKFNPQQKKIEELERNSPRFKRIYDEYESMSDELYFHENSHKSTIPDDFIDALKTQTEYLEDEIGNWILNNSKSESETK